jgi:uncharacterized membrane protein
MDDSTLVVLGLVWILNLSICVVIAQHKELSMFDTVAAAILLGPIAIIYVLLVKPPHAPA